MISQLISAAPSIVNAVALVAGAAFVALAYSSMALLGRRVVILVATAATVGSTVFLSFQAWHYGGTRDLFLVLWFPVVSAFSLFGASALGVLWPLVPRASVLRATIRGTAAACVSWLGGLLGYPLMLALLHAH